MSTNWKLIGKNSGNMSQYRNVTHNKLNYETGKLNSIYDVSGIPTKGYTFDICGENIVLGVGTDKPFSRLSLGNNTDSGEFNANKPGQLSAIALDESGTGNSFTGIVLNSDITTLDGNPTKGIQIMSSTSDFSMNDTTNTGKIILSNENVTTIGGNSRGKPGGYSPISTKKRDIVLDVRGSIRTDGYINFYDSPNVNDPTVPPASSWTTPNTGDVPRGSLFLTSDDGGIEGLWFKNNAGTLVQITGGGGGGGVGTGSSFDICGTGTDSFIVAKNTGNTYGGTPVIFSGDTWNPASNPRSDNAVTIRDGNLAVITPSGDYLKVISPTLNAESHFTDNSGGIILAQKQLLIGAPSSLTVETERFGYGLIDVQSVDKVPTLQGYNHIDTKSFRPTAATNSIILLTKDSDHDGQTDGGKIGNIYDCSNTIIIGGSNFSQIDTPNSIISINPDLETDKTSIIDISGSNLVFGANNDLSGSPFSIMFGTGNKIDNTEKTVPEGKENVVLGSTNNLYNSQNSLVQGTGNINYGNLNVIFGKKNKIGNVFDDHAYYKYSGSNCFIQGSENEIKAYDVSLNNAFIAGYKNTLDCSYVAFEQNPNSSYILLGSKAKINKDISNVRLAFGTKEMTGNVFTIDMSGNTHIFGDLTVDGSNISTNHIFANNIIANDISGHDSSFNDISAVNFFTTDGNFVGNINIAIGTSNFNDISANDISCVDISAVNGYFTGDLSCNGLNMNSNKITNLSDPESEQDAVTKSWVETQLTGGGGSGVETSATKLKVYQYTSEDTTPRPIIFAATTGGFQDCSGTNTFTYTCKTQTVTSRTFAGDVSGTNLFINSSTGDISGQDASFNDISAVNFFTTGGNFIGDVMGNVSGTNLFIKSSTGDISGHDASFNDISAVNFFTTGGNFIGNVNTTIGSSRFKDISATDISCVDISASHFYHTGAATADISDNNQGQGWGVIDISNNLLNLIKYLRAIGIVPPYTT